LAVANKGQADAGPFTVTFYYGDSTSIANIETLGNANLNGVLAGQSSSPINLKFKLPNTILSGKRYIHYYIDSADRIGEITEANNRGHREIEITGLPNLQISEFAISPANQRANGHIIITYRVINSGKSRVPSTSRLAFYHSTDATIDATDALRTWITVPVLEAGASHPEKDKDSGNITITVPATAISGATEYIGIFADYNDQIQESNEADNTKAEPFRVVDAMVDLLIHSWSFSPEKVSGYNSAISIDFRVRNSGNADALTQFDVSFYYSDSTSTEGMVFLGKESVRRVDQNTIDSTRTVIANLPRSALTGKRYIHYFIDSDNKIIEYRKDNNRGFAEIEITGLPNLQVSVLSISPTTQAPGSSIDVTYRLYNGGLTRADNFKIGFYHSTDANIDTKDTLLHTINVSKLEAQSFEPAVGNATVSVRLPTSIPPGAAYIGTYVDNEDVIKELAETDNTRYTAITISAPKPDLEATILRIAPVTQKVNQTVTVTYTISNRGGQDAVAFRVGIYYSADAIISDTDTLLTTFTVNVVKSNDQHSSSQSVTLPVSLPGGAGYIGIFVDDDKKIDETDEANNTASTAITVLVDRDGDKYYSDVDCDDNDPDVYPGAPEICNGKDNNCDGLIDNDPKCICKSTDPPRPCYSGSTGCTKQADESYQCVGTCKAGTQSCINGQWAACVGEVTPQIEICDGLDNNCNSLVDENLTRHCYTGTTGCTQQADGSYQCNNPCRAGTQTCINGQWDVCNGEVIASTETCDGIDNDCDGQIDNQPGTANPLEQPCSNTCGSGVEVCLNGQWQNCSAPLTCEPTDEPITPDGGGIIDQAPETPPNCYVTGCPPDQICKAGQCVNNPCYNITCQPDQFCRDGQCIDACDCTVCSVGKSCIDGQCVIDPCSGVSCPAGDICDPLTGQCKADPCQGVSCDSGLICEDGRCIDDPCKFIKCPQDQVCRKAQCVGQQCEQEPTIEPFTPDASDPDAATPDAADPDTATPDAADPDTATPDAADPDTATPDAADPDAADPDAADPDTATPDAADLDAPKSDAEVQDKVIPGTDRDQVDSVEPPQGCACNVAQSTPISLLFFVLLFSLITLRRKRNHA
jgi:subtilase family serine protease